jgi:predicted DNA-binding transcriptional regulator AlpA
MDRALKITRNSEERLVPATEDRGGPAPSGLLTAEQLAQKLSVPTSWVREKTRERARLRDLDPLPVVRLGKYVRFDPAAVNAWVARQST